MSISADFIYERSWLDHLDQDLEKFRDDPLYQEIENEAKDPTIHLESAPFLASCYFDEHRITLDPTLFKSKIGNTFPMALQYYLFELANLSQVAKFKSLIHRVTFLTPDKFVEEYERIEHQSALKIKEILRKCLPKEEWGQYSMTRVPENFELHFLVQQMSGHSGTIWERYADLFPPHSFYIGTWDSVPEDEKPFLMALIDFQSRKQDPDPAIAAAGEAKYALVKELLCRQHDDLRHRLIARIQHIEQY